MKNMTREQVAAVFVELTGTQFDYAEDLLKLQDDLLIASLLYAYVCEPNNPTSRTCLMFLLGNRWAELEKLKNDAH